MAIFSYRYGSHFREGFSADQIFHLRQAASLRQELALSHNGFVQSLLSIIFTKSPDAVGLHLDFVKNKNKASSFEVAKKWRAMIRHHSGEFAMETANFYARVKQIIGQSELFWPNRDGVYDDFMRSHRRAMYTLDPIEFSSDLLASQTEHRPAGRFLYRFTRPTSCDDLFSGRLPVKVMQPSAEGAAAQIAFPIATTARGQYITATWPITWHRPLLADALIKSVSIAGVYVGSEWRLIATFVLQKNAGLDLCSEGSVTRSILGVDVGWRKSERGLKVATVNDAQGNYHHYFLPPSWLKVAQFISDLDCELTKDLQAMTGDDRQWYLQVNHKNHDLGNWIQVHQPKIRERNNKKARLARWRLDLYRQFARQICQSATVVRMESLHLRPMMSIESKQGPAQKTQQKLAAVTLLQKAIEEAGVKHDCKIEYLSAKNTTRIHADCGHLNPVLKGPTVRCHGCSLEFDQDENASRLLAIGNLA